LGIELVGHDEVKGFKGCILTSRSRFRANPWVSG
jgi:hypothetical protein